jgi:nicotinamide-nucleotide amidase
MEVTIVAIGDEILIGQVLDTNSVWITKELTALGVHVSEMVSISDTPEHINTTLDRLIGNTDMILMTGGLGPTKDDLTKETLTSYFGGELVVDQSVLKTITDFFEKRGRTMIDSNTHQALVPNNCKVLTNNFGTAPGMWFTKKNTHVISMPGVPYEMKPMVRDQVIPAMHEALEMPVLVNKTVMTQGVPESYLAEKIKDWENGLPACMKLAYLPRPGIVRLRLTVSGQYAEKANEMIEQKLELLNEIIGKHIFAYDDTMLEEVIGQELATLGYMLSTAESCTGGNIARLITSVPGSSGYFKGSVIAYSNEVKQNQLNVDAALIEKNGAVSKEVVEAMAKGIQVLTGSEVSLATSGIAGPDGGTADKPVGTVWIAVSVNEQTISKMFNFGGHRELIIEQASIMALGILRKQIAGLNVENL